MNIDTIPRYNVFSCLRIADKKKLRFCREEENSYFVFLPRSRSKGWRFTKEDFLKKYDPKIPTPEEEDAAWRKRMRKAVRLMKASNLWAPIRKVFENLLNVSMEDYREMKKIYLDYDLTQEGRKQKLLAFREKYPFLFNEDGYISTTDYFYEVSECRLKPMYFGKFDNLRIKEEIDASLRNQTFYMTGRIPVNYDVSFEYQPKYQRAWYSEEYRNCGNGYYYLALDHNTALFYEKD